MTFKTLNNIEKTFKFSRRLSLFTIALSVVLSLVVVVLSYDMVRKEREKIYVLDRGKSLILALQTDMSQNRPVEARDHVRMFHELFFSLSPDNEAINTNLKRALELADKTAYNYFKDFLEAGYYNRIIRANIIQRIKIDSIECNFDSYPYSVVTHCQQIITRESNVTVRQLQTSCLLENTTRSDNNSHGFLITEFKILNNKTQKDD